MIAVHQLSQFIGSLALASGLTGLGLDAAKVASVQEHGSLSRILSQKSLMLRLTEFCHAATQEYAARIFALRCGAGGVFFVRSKIFGSEAEVRQTELYAFHMMLETIRIDLGQSWFPRFVEFQSECADDIEKTFNTFAARGKFRQDETRIFVTTQELGRIGNPFAITAEPQTWEASTKSVQEFTANLISNHLSDVRLSLNFISRISGFHERELQRLLEAEQTSFSELLKVERLRSANRLLVDSSLSIGEVSRSLGYSNQANFTRAFISAIGIAPSEFRKLFRC